MGVGWGRVGGEEFVRMLRNVFVVSTKRLLERAWTVRGSASAFGASNPVLQHLT